MNFKIVVIHVRSADWKHWKLNDFEGGKSWCTECSLSQSAVLQKYFVLGDLWVNGGFFQNNASDGRPCIVHFSENTLK